LLPIFAAQLVERFSAACLGCTAAIAKENFMQPLDFSVRAPRSPREKVGGLYMLGRTIDKLRATLPGGNLGPYHVFFGLSKALAHALGIDLHELAGVVERAASEDEVVAWVREHSDPSKYEEINRTLEGRTQDDIRAEHRAVFESKYDFGMRAAHHNLFDLVDADDKKLFAGTQ
jgi:Domain of unknown function (DUF5069)